MFTEEEMQAFYEGKEAGYNEVPEAEVLNPHLQFIDKLTNKGMAYSVDNPLYQHYQRGYEWGKAQKAEESAE